ncbi:MAG: dienelactone hydrolase family protein [Deltaproteobacteria bacterium]|nr:dienelactone hydrolase family protein [Deltaproteobacteria bacterium]
MTKVLLLASGLMVLLLLTPDKEVQAKLVTKTVEYQQDGTLCKGFLAFDDAFRGKRPGVLVVHEYWGLNDFARRKAEQLAGLGYVALAADIYGNGKVTKDPQEAARLANELRVDNKPLLRARAQAALKALAANPRVDPTRLGAIGFCFGGTTVLDLAYSGADLKGVVSFHGGLTVPKQEELTGMKAAILALHGADDPYVKPEAVTAFQEAMRKGGIDWQMVYFGDAVHGYMNPENGGDNSKGVAYNARAAKRSWQYMKDFFKEMFAVKGRD